MKKFECLNVCSVIRSLAPVSCILASRIIWLALILLALSISGDQLLVYFIQIFSQENYLQKLVNAFSFIFLETYLKGVLRLLALYQVQCYTTHQEGRGPLYKLRAVKDTFLERYGVSFDKPSFGFSLVNIVNMLSKEP